MRFSRVSGLLSLLVATGCAVPGGGRQPLAITSPPGFTQRAVQQLRFEQAGRVISLDAVVEVGDDRIVMVGLGPLGKRLFVLRVGPDGALESEFDAHMPAQIDARRMVSDLMLIYWPLTAVEAALPQGQRVEQQGRSRWLRGKDRVLARVDCDAVDRWATRCVLHDEVRSYVLSIDSKRDAP